MASSGTVRIDALGRDNYDTWKMQMRAILVMNEVWGQASGATVKPEAAADNANAAEITTWESKDEKAKSLMILSMGSPCLKLIKNCATSHAIWQKLEDSFASKGPVRKATLLQSLTLKKMNDGEDARDNLSNYFDVIDKLAVMNTEIPPDLGSGF